MDSENLLLLIAAGAAIYYFGPALKNLGSAAGDVTSFVSSATGMLAPSSQTFNPPLQVNTGPTNPLDWLGPVLTFGPVYGVNQLVQGNQQVHW